jgi:uncharacterized sodium:solute symporter family permease YidK
MYGTQGRIISAIAATAGIVAAFVSSSQQAGLFTLVPAKYNWFVTAIPIVSLFLTGFSERIQGGASDPVVRAEAQAADQKVKP